MGKKQNKNFKRERSLVGRVLACRVKGRGFNSRRSRKKNMGQKAHPTSLRLYKTNRFAASAWYSDLYYTNLFLKDHYVKETAKKISGEAKYIDPLSFASFWKKNCDLFIFFLSKKKQFKDLKYRFRTPQKKQKKRKQHHTKLYPGKSGTGYKKFFLNRMLWEKEKEMNGEIPLHSRKILLWNILVKRTNYEETL